MISFSIRAALPADAAICADIHMRSWIFAYSECLPMEVIAQHNARRPVMWRQLLEHNKDTHYVATYQDRIIGIITINPSDDTDLPNSIYELTGLYLDPDAIGKGFGKLTMDWVKREIYARGCRGISLWVLDRNERAKAFYKHSGFQPDGISQESGLGNTRKERYLCKLVES